MIDPEDVLEGGEAKGDAEEVPCSAGSPLPTEPFGPPLDGGQESREPGWETGDMPVSLEDLSKALLNQMADLRSAIPAGESPPVGVGLPVEKEGDRLEEIADDMLALMRKLSDLGRGQQQLFERLDRLEETWGTAMRAVAREMDSLRRDLLGERKHAAVSDLYGEVIPMLERLRILRGSLCEPADARTIQQTDSVIETLAAFLRRSGCVPFETRVGEPFDPTRMECIQYAEDGEAGVVLASLRPGYRTGERVFRPAGVRIAVPLP
jgi:molecular chaperone GrpE (heat shock protein)